MKVGKLKIIKMRKLLLSLFVLLTYSISFASNTTNNSNPNESVTLEIKTMSGKETTVMTINFNSFEDFKNFNTKQLDIDDDCLATITVTVSVGVGSTYVSVTVTAEVPCDEIADYIHRIRAQISQEIGG